MHPADIKAAIEKAGSSQAAIARSLLGKGGKPITSGAVYLVIKGSSRSERIAAAISQVTGLPVSVLWPGRYPELELAEVQRSSLEPQKGDGV